MIWSTFLIKTLGNALSNMIIDLKKEISDAIVSIVEGANQLNMDSKVPDLELLREKDGKFKK